MNIIKFLKLTLLSTMLFTTLYGCKKCKNEQPRARIINNGTQKASVQIKTSGGNTVNINNVDPGTSSAYNSYDAGQVTFTIKFDSVDYVKTVDLVSCYDYDIAINKDNYITSAPINRND